MGLTKKDCIHLLEEIATYLELKGENPFRISAYRKAAQGLERDERSLIEIDDFTKIKGIGAGTGALLKEFVENDGISETLEELKKEVPETLIPLLKIPGLGGKRLSRLYQELAIVDEATLKEALETGKVEQLSGFGKKTVDNMLRGLAETNTRPERLPISLMLSVAEKIEAHVATIEEVERFSRAGSLRRLKETIGDLDFIISTRSPSVVREKLLALKTIKDVIAQGDTKVSVTIEDEFDINIDFRMVRDDQFATTLHHFTGSKDHNVRMRQLAKARGESISEYGVLNEETGETKTFPSEAEFFEHFGLPFISPERRETGEEVERVKELDGLLELDDIRGDLHMHTTWSDGALSIEEMIGLCRSRGYEYIAITDHSKYLRVANGLNEKRLLEQNEEIQILNKKYDDIHIFHGVEMDILPNGELDFSEDFLQSLDYTIGAIHSSFNQSEEEIMRRMFRAMENPYVNVIAHPTGRLIGRREGYKVDLDALIEKARETNTALEINANPNRLDLSVEWARKAQDAGVKISINTDAHNAEMLTHMRYGVAVGMKAWLRPENVINCWTKQQLKTFFNRKG